MVSMTEIEKPARLTSKEALHAVAVGHLQQAAARICCQGGVGAVRQQDSHNIQVVILHSVVNRSRQTQMYILRMTKNGTDNICMVFFLSRWSIKMLCIASKIYYYKSNCDNVITDSFFVISAVLLLVEFLKFKFSNNLLCPL